MNKQNKIQYLKPMRNCYNTNDELKWVPLNSYEKSKKYYEKIDRDFFVLIKKFVIVINLVI